MGRKPEMNRAWDEWVDKANPPQRACIGVALEDKDLVEILVIAAQESIPVTPPCRSPHAA